MNDLTIIPPPGGKKVAILDVVTHPLVHVFKTGHWCKQARRSAQVLKTDPYYRLDLYCGDAAERPKIIAKAKEFRELLLPFARQLRAASDQLEDLIDPDCPNSEEVVAVTPVVARQMITLLFNARSKKKGDEAETRLAACVSLFDPVNNVIGVATGLWADLPRHPVILALAIKKLIQESVFTPEPAELATACRTVRRHLREMLGYVDDVLLRLRYDEDVLFEYDREEWKTAYRSKAAIDAGAKFSKNIANDEQFKTYGFRLMALEDLDIEMNGPREDNPEEGSDQ